MKRMRSRCTSEGSPDTQTNSLSVCLSKERKIYFKRIGSYDCEAGTQKPMGQFSQAGNSVRFSVLQSGGRILPFGGMPVWAIKTFTGIGLDEAYPHYGA